MKRHLFIALFALSSSTALAQQADTSKPASAEPSKDTSALEKLKLSGYVQARYVYTERDEELDLTGESRFLVRRSRLKATYTSDIAQFMLQLDATLSSVGLRDAEATLFVPGTKQKLSLTVGQMKWPFGFEAVQSSSEREFPERSRVVRAFLQDERDLGAKVSAKYGVLRFAGGVFNGTGIGYRTTAGGSILSTDNDKAKDAIGRLGVDLKWLSGGISGWYGLTLGRGPADTYRRAYDRTRLGLDLQVRGDLLPIGATSLKLEYITGKSYLRSGVEQFGVPASGWYALLVQHVGQMNAVALRYDYFDPSNGRGPVEAAANANNAVGTLGIAGIHHFGEDLKATLAYELPMTATLDDVADPQDNVLTFQLQARF